MATSLLKWKENIQFKENKGYCFKHLYLKPLKKIFSLRRDLCINRDNHQKPTFHSLGNFLNPALALPGQGLKKSPIGQKLDFANHPYLCKGRLEIRSFYGYR